MRVVGSLLGTCFLIIAAGTKASDDTKGRLEGELHSHLYEAPANSSGPLADTSEAYAIASQDYLVRPFHGSDQEISTAVFSGKYQSTAPFNTVKNACRVYTVLKDHPP